MDSELFAALLESASEARDHARGKRQLRTTVLPGAPKLMSADDVRTLREQVNASQAVFAHYLNVSTKLVQAWEADRRRPDGAALRLLEIAVREPAVVFYGIAPSADVAPAVVEAPAGKPAMRNRTGAPARKPKAPAKPTRKKRAVR